MFFFEDFLEFHGKPEALCSYILLNPIWLARLTCNQEPGTRNQEPGIRNQEAGTRNQEPGTRNQEPGTKHQEPATTMQS